MKVALTASSTVTINGVTMILDKGTEVELPCETREHALALCNIAKLFVDLSYTEDGVKYIAGAGGKFIAQPVATPKVEPEAPKAKAKKASPKAKK
jgi:hypothetical protein